MAHFSDSKQSLVAVAEPLDGVFVQGLGEVARNNGLTVICGMWESADAKRVYNTLVAIGPDGRLIGSYRKIHLYDAFGHKESDKIKPGDGETLTFQLGGITFGVMTCYDVRFPELARCLVDRGAEAIVLPSGWVHGLLKEDHWEVLVRARAIENTVYMVACDQVKNIYSGSSMVVDPLGVVRARAGEEPELLMGELTPDRIREARLKLPSLLHRRFSVRLEKAVPTVTG